MTEKHRQTEWLESILGAGPAKAHKLAIGKQFHELILHQGIKEIAWRLRKGLKKQIGENLTPEERQKISASHDSQSVHQL